MKNDEVGDVTISNSSQIPETEGTSCTSCWAYDSGEIQEQFTGRRQQQYTHSVSASQQQLSRMTKQIPIACPEQNKKIYQ